MNASGSRNMTVGSPAGHIITFALPLLAGNFLQQLYNMVDSWVVGQYVGDSALAAVGIAFPVMFMFNAIFIGLSTGGTVVIAQFFGAGKTDRVRDAIDTIYAAFLLVVIPISVIAIAVMKPLLTAMQVDPAAFDEAWLYLVVVCAGLIGTIGYNLNAGILSGLGNSRTTLLFLSIAALLNIVLDLAFVLLFHLGVLGVALATIMAQAVSCLFGLFYINRRYPAFAIRLTRLRLDRALLGQIVSIGLPAALQMSLVSISSVVVMGKINSFGEAYSAGFNVGLKLDQLAFLPVQSLSTAAMSFVGQNTGANLPNRVRQGIRLTVIASAVWSLLMAAILVPTAPALVAVFSDTPAVINAGVTYIRCIMPFYAAFGVMYAMNDALRGAGASMLPLAVNIVNLLLIRTPLMYWLADHWGPDYMHYSSGIGWVAGAVLAVVYYLSGRWQKRGSLAESLLT